MAAVWQTQKIRLSWCWELWQQSGCSLGGSPACPHALSCPGSHQDLLETSHARSHCQCLVRSRAGLGWSDVTGVLRQREWETRSPWPFIPAVLNSQFLIAVCMDPHNFQFQLKERGKERKKERSGACVLGTHVVLAMILTPYSLEFGRLPPMLPLLQ